MYECLNLVCEPDGTPGCVLIRALEPVAGIETHAAPPSRGAQDEDLASGPGKLTLALGITRPHNGADVTRGAWWSREPAERSHSKSRSPRDRHPPVRRFAAALSDRRESSG